MIRKMPYATTGTIPSMPVSTYQFQVRWTLADDRTIKKLLSYFRLDTPHCDGWNLTAMRRRFQQSTSGMIALCPGITG
jgi:hypothetical protein